MTDLDAFRSAFDPRRSRPARRDGPNRYSDAVDRYLSAFGYAEGASLPGPVRQPPRQRAPSPWVTAENRGPSTEGRIVVGVDASPGSFVALDQATIEAELRGSEMRLVHVQNAGSAGGSSRNRGSALVWEMSDRVHGWSPDVAVVSGLRTGVPGAVLIEESAGADLLVVGARGHGYGAGGLLGSVSSYVAAHARRPVLVVRVPGWPPRPGWAVRPVVVGVDGSPGSIAALEFAVGEARLRGSELVVLHAVEPSEIGGHADSLTEDRLAALAVVDAHVHPRRVNSDPRSALLASSASAAAVVVGSPGRSGVGAPMLGSVSRALIHYAHCPVFVVHR